MNPQDNNGGGAVPQFDGFGGPNISYENYGTPEPDASPMPQMAPQTINLVNANGVVSGQKMVEYVWKRIAYCGIVFSLVLLIGLVIAVVLVGLANTDKATALTEKEATERNLRGIYNVLAVSNQEEAIQALDKESEYLNGGDLQKIDSLLSNKYGDYLVDFADSNINFIKINNMFKVISVGIKQPKGTARVLLYARISTGEWKLGGFNSANTADPCADSTDEEKEAFSNIISCKESSSGSQKEDPEPDPEPEPDPDDDTKKEEDPDGKKEEGSDAGDDTKKEDDKKKD